MVHSVQPSAIDGRESEGVSSGVDQGLLREKMLGGQRGVLLDEASAPVRMLAPLDASSNSKWQVRWLDCLNLCVCYLPSSLVARESLFVGEPV